MSLISVFAIFVSIMVCSAVDVSRICSENKDYVDAGVSFKEEFWVIIDRMYYAFQYPEYMIYKEEGIQEIFLREWDESYKKWSGEKESLRKGRYLGGFFHPEIPYYHLEEDPLRYKDERDMPVDKSTLFTKDKSGLKEQDFLNKDQWDKHLADPKTESAEPPINKSVPPFEDIHTVWHYFLRFTNFQTIILKDEVNNKLLYHFKWFDASRGRYLEYKQQTFHHFEPQDLKEPIGFDQKGLLNNLLLLPKELDPSLTSLPIIYDLPTMTLFLIINPKTSDGVPELWFNSFKYRQFKKTWKSVVIPKGYRYNAFIPEKTGQAFYDEGDEPIPYFTYYLIAESFRDVSKDKGRGPSFLFKLEFSGNGTTGVSDVRLKKLPQGGMSYFNCKFISPSSQTLYYVFGSIIAVLCATLVVVFLFVFVNYFFANERIVIVRKGRTIRTPNRAISLDRNRIRRRTETSTDAEKHTARSASLGSGRVSVTPDKKIKL